MTVTEALRRLRSVVRVDENIKIAQNELDGSHLCLDECLIAQMVVSKNDGSKVFLSSRARRVLLDHLNENWDEISKTVTKSLIDERSFLLTPELAEILD